MRGLGVDLVRLRESVVANEPEVAPVLETQPEQQDSAPVMRPRCPTCGVELDGNLVETVVTAERAGDRLPSRYLDDIGDLTAVDDAHETVVAVIPEPHTVLGVDADAVRSRGVERGPVHPGQHEHLAGPGFLDHRGDEPRGIPLELVLDAHASIRTGTPRSRR